MSRFNEERKVVFKLLDNGYHLKNIKKEYSENPFVFNKAVSINGTFLENIDKKHYDKPLLETAFKDNNTTKYFNKKYLKDKYLKDKDLAFMQLYNIAKKGEYYLYNDFDISFKKDIKFAKLALSLDPKFYNFIENKFRKDEKICLYMIKEDAFFYDRLDESMKKKDNILIEAIMNKYAYHSSLMGNYKKLDKNILRKVVERTGGLEKLPTCEKTMDIVLYAISRDISNLEYVPVAIKDKIKDSFT